MTQALFVFLLFGMAMLRLISTLKQSFYPKPGGRSIRGI
jgi:hypothetical protein